MPADRAGGEGALGGVKGESRERMGKQGKLYGLFFDYY